MKIKKSELRQYIRDAIKEISTSSATPGFKSKNFLDPDFPESLIPKSKGGDVGTGDDRETKKRSPKDQELGPGMELLRDAIREIVKEMMSEESDKEADKRNEKIFKTDGKKVLQAFKKYDDSERYEKKVYNNLLKLTDTIAQKINKGMILKREIAEIETWDYFAKVADGDMAFNYKKYITFITR